MLNKTTILLFLFAATVVCKAQHIEKEIFICPLELTPSLSASFAELRNDHFHSGLDLKTGGVTGKEVRAASDGYVYRISVSPTGYGRALYLRHPNGYSTVYAHLESFSPSVEEFVIERQYELKSFSVTLYPVRDQFPVKKGEIIAFSGNSGGSTGPHLHFEVRESATEEPVNPLIFGLGVDDNVRPTVEKIILYPLTKNSSVNRSHKPLTVRATGSGGKYIIITDQPVIVNGQIGIGVKCWDSFDNSSNKCGVYSVYASVDSTVTYGFTARQFSFSESRYLNSHIDYHAKAADNEYIHKLFLEPGNKLSMYSNLVNRGILRFYDDLNHPVSITVSDEAGNRSVVSFRVRSVSAPPVEPLEITCSKVLPYGKSSDFTADGIRVHFPPLSFYDSIFFTYSVRPSNGRFLSPIHSVHNEFTAVHDLFRLSVRPDTVITGREDKMCLVRIDRDGFRSYAGGEYRYGFVSAEVRLLGDYAITTDTVSPVIKPSFIKGSDLSDTKSFTVTITDEFSGIRSYDTMIDGTWALLEYDIKTNHLIYRFDSMHIKENSLHVMELKVADNRGNISVLKTEFKW